jgi:hypothetical protein
MKGNDAALNGRVRRSSGLMREIIDLADEQGWTFRIKEEGLLFRPPLAITRPGYECVFARDPGSDSGRQRQMKERFRKAGMRFPEDQPPERIPRVTTSKTALTVKGVPTVPTESDPIARIEANIGVMVTALSEIERDLAAVKKDQAAVAVIRNAFKSLG